MLDASVAVAASFGSQFMLAARLLVEGRDVQLFGPTLLRGEVVNSGLRLHRRGRLDDRELAHSLAEFDRLSIEYLYDPAWVDRALEIAMRFRQSSVFDAIYLACAEDLDAELWIADRRFVASFGGECPARLRLCPDDV